MTKHPDPERMYVRWGQHRYSVIKRADLTKFEGPLGVEVSEEEWATATEGLGKKLVNMYTKLNKRKQ